MSAIPEYPDRLIHPPSEGDVLDNEGNVIFTGSFIRAETMIGGKKAGCILRISPDLLRDTVDADAFIARSVDKEFAKLAAA